MNKLKYLLCTLLLFPCLLQATEIAESLVDARNESAPLIILEFAKDICGFSLGTSGYDSEIRCSSTECKKKLKIIESSYNLDILVTPEYKIVLASTNKKAVGKSKGSASYTDIFELMSGWDVEVEKIPFPKEQASHMAACINEIGNELTNKLLSKEQKELVNKHNTLSPLSKTNEIEKKINLDQLEYATLRFVYPELLKDSNSGFVYVTVIPSMRFANRPNITDKTEIKSAAIELSGVAKRMKPINSELNSILSKLDLQDSGDSVYRKSKSKGGELFKIDNIFKILKLSLVGNGYEITSLSPEEQALSPFIESRWVWEIKSVKPSDEPLILVAESKSSEYSNDLYSNQIPIFVKHEESILLISWSFLRRNWQFILGTILIPLGVYVWRRKADSSTA